MSHAREPGQARKRAARPGMLDALGLRDGEGWGASLFDDERPPRTCPPLFILIVGVQQRVYCIVSNSSKSVIGTSKKELLPTTTFFECNQC